MFEKRGQAEKWFTIIMQIPYVLPGGCGEAPIFRILLRRRFFTSFRMTLLACHRVIPSGCKESRVPKDAESDNRDSSDPSYPLNDIGVTCAQKNLDLPLGELASAASLRVQTGMQHPALDILSEEIPKYIVYQ